MKKIKLTISALAAILISFSVKSQIVMLENDTTKIPEVILEEIIIRAPKIYMTLKELPGSATIVSSRTIEQTGMQSVKDITAYTPNFFMPDYGSKFTSPVMIRGIGSRINEPSIGLYVDNVPYFEKAAFDFELFDINRIEVLRGPQGTLYGRNTMGGIINIITRSPMNYQGTDLILSAGNYGRYQASVSHFAKPGDNFGYSLSANFRHNDGFFSNSYNDEKIDHLSNLGIRNRLVWRINQRLTAENILGYEYTRQGAYPYYMLDENGDYTEIDYNHPSSFNRDLITNGLVIRYTGSGFDIISTSAYQYLEGKDEVDQDFTSSEIFEIVRKNAQLDHLFSQEVVFKSKYSHRYEWVSGVYGFYQASDRQVDLLTTVTPQLPPHLPPMLPIKEDVLAAYDEARKGVAVFHQSTMKNLFIPNLSLTFGLRLDAKQNEMTYSIDTISQGAANSQNSPRNISMDFIQLLPKIALRYELSKSVSQYFLISKGYKTGGFNAIFEREEDITFEPEYSWNFEYGIRSSFMDERIQADAAVFYIDWKNQQIYQALPSGEGVMLKNAGESVSKGVEFTLRASLPYHFDGFISYGYTDAKFIKHVVDENKDYSGNYIPFVPKQTMAIQLNKNFELRNNKIVERFNVTALYRLAGQHYWNEQNSQSQDSYGLLDLRGGVSFRNFRLGLWARNVLGTEYASYYFDIDSPRFKGQYAQKGKPFHFGANLAVSF